MIIHMTLYTTFVNIIGECLPISEECVEPSNLEDRFQKLNYGLDLRSLLLPQPWNNLDVEFEYIFSITNTHSIRNVCPEVPIKGNYPLMLRTSCPWYLDTDRNKFRYPESIVFANTKCDNGCIGSKGEQGCERINYQIKILKKTGCKDNIYQYEVEHFLLPIGYTCAQAREAEKSKEIPSDLPPPL